MVLTRMKLKSINQSIFDWIIQRYTPKSHIKIGVLQWWKYEFVNEIKTIQPALILPQPIITDLWCSRILSIVIFILRMYLLWNRRIWLELNWTELKICYRVHKIHWVASTCFECEEQPTVVWTGNVLDVWWEHLSREWRSLPGRLCMQAQHVRKNRVW